MKVSNKISNPMQNAEAAKLNKTATGEGSATKSRKSVGASAFDGASSKTDLSARSQEIKKAKELATPSTSIDEAKVARLQKLIDEGKYKVDAEEIADRLVDEHLLTPS